MKKLFVMAMAALLAVACAQEQKQASAIERANEFNERVITTLAIIDIEEIGKAGGPDQWYASLDQEQQMKVVEACKEFTAIQAERAQWLRELNPEDQAIVREEIKKMGMDNEMRKINIMQRLMMLSKSNSVR
jgi:hypothetical protein